MTAGLRELLDDLAASEPVPTPGLAERAWVDGRRRRLRSRLQVAVAAAAALALVALVTPGLPAQVGVPQFAGGGAQGVHGYPERIGRQWWVRDLPDRPGPVAAVLDAASSWYAIRADGHRWRLPGEAGLQVPALSQDGRMLGYLARTEGPYVLHDLVTGRRVVLDELYAGGRLPAPGHHQLTLGRPGLWSPDRGQLLLSGGGGMLVVDATDGRIERMSPSGVPLGWVADDRIAWLHVPGSDEKPLPLTVRVTDLAGRVQSEVPLAGSLGLSTGFDALRPDGAELAVVVHDDAYELIRFGLPDGTPVQEPVRLEASFACAPSYSSEGALVLSVSPPDGGHATGMEVTPAGPRPFTVAAPSVQAHCVHWAGDALAGPARGGGLLGTHDAAWTWWWREILLGALGLVVAAAVLRRHPIRLRRRAPAAPRDVSWYG
jgi:hypothetical protein